MLRKILVSGLLILALFVGCSEPNAEVEPNYANPGGSTDYQELSGSGQVEGNNGNDL